PWFCNGFLNFSIKYLSTDFVRALGLFVGVLQRNAFGFIVFAHRLRLRAETIPHSQALRFTSFPAPALVSFRQAEHTPDRQDTPPDLHTHTPEKSGALDTNHPHHSLP